MLLIWHVRLFYCICNLAHDYLYFGPDFAILFLTLLLLLILNVFLFLIVNVFLFLIVIIHQDFVDEIWCIPYRITRMALISRYLSGLNLMRILQGFIRRLVIEGGCLQPEDIIWSGWWWQLFLYLLLVLILGNFLCLCGYSHIQASIGWLLFGPNHLSMFVLFVLLLNSSLTF